MENLLVIGALVAVFYLIILPIIAFLAHARATEARRQLEAVKARLARAEAAIAASTGRVGAVETTSGEPGTEAAIAAVAQPQPTPVSTPPTQATAQPRPPQPPTQPAPKIPPAAEPPVAAHPAMAGEQPAGPPTKPAPIAVKAKAPRIARPEAPDASPLAGIIGWFVRGNPLAKIGALLLFFGLAYLFKYSVDHALIPVELRLAGAGLLSLGLLGVGWRLRTKQPLYGLILQGTAVGAFYLTAFAAFRLYQLLPHGAVFALMIVICAASVVLSVLQRAQSLAVIAALGGYLAPLLLSTGGGSHVALFSYYAMLSTGILAVSVWQIWRPLNLVGFVFTFGVAAYWAWDAYEPAFYTSCQLFLILNFLIFGIAAPLAALRHDSKNLRFVDGTLVFGTPLVAFGMQYAMMRLQGWTMGAAFSCLVLGAIYLPLSRMLMRRWPEAGRRMALSFIALGGCFVTLAIPLALSARWTSLAWALEGLGLIWVGLGQQHRKMAWSGTLLILAAGISAGVAWPFETVTLLLVFGVLALCCLVGGWLWSRHSPALPEAPLATMALWLGGIGSWLFWVFAGADRLLAPLRPDLAFGSAYDQLVFGGRTLPLLAGLAATALSTCIWTLAGERLRWRLLRHSCWLLWPIAGLTLTTQLASTRHPFAGYPGWCWAIVFGCAIWILKRTETDLPMPRLRSAAHVGLCWLVLAVCGTEVAWRASELPWGAEALAPTIILCALALPILAVALLGRRPWPVRAQPTAWWLIGLAPVLPLSFIALLGGNLSDAQILGWQYVPLINPLEESAAFLLLMLYLWQRRVPAPPALWRVPTMLLVMTLAAWWFNGALVRALSHYGDIPWDFDALWHSRLVQTTLAIVWTLAAMALMVIAKRRTSQPVWIVGAVVLGVVIIKLFLVDSARGGGLARAIAFIGVAVLVLLIGYIAPLPPRKTSGAAHSA